MEHSNSASRTMQCTNGCENDRTHYTFIEIIHKYLEDEGMPSSFSRTATIAAVLALGVSASSLPAHAGPTAAQLLSGYNLILTGNDSSQSDVEGNAVIGGNITKGHTFFNSRAPANPAVILYGSITGNQINLNSSGSLYAPTSQSGKVNYNGGGSYKGAPTQTLATYTDPLSALSTSLSHLASTGSTLTVSGDTATFDAKPGVGGIAVFDLAASTLEDLSNVNVVFDQDAGTKGIIVNVSGIGATTFSISSSVNWNQAAQTDVLFNFFDADLDGDAEGLGGISAGAGCHRRNSMEAIWRGRYLRRISPAAASCTTSPIRGHSPARRCRSRRRSRSSDWR